MLLLHVTNGTAIIAKIRAAGVSGRIVPWNDILHEGPVPAGLNVAALRDVRASFIAQGDGSFAEIEREFLARDAALDDLDAIDEVVLWLEHDLYDQLQLIQILDRLPDRGPRITAVPDDDYLGMQPEPRFRELFAARREISSAERVAARDAWEAFRAQDPRAIQHALPRLTVLPHLVPALHRHLEQFPAVGNGLSRTEQQTLEAIAAGHTHTERVYRAANHEREKAVFMGDFTFLLHIRSLARGARPLIVGGAALDDSVALTEDGRRVLSGDADRVALCGIDRWLGGVHVHGYGPVWRWDHARQTLHFT